MTAIIDLYEKFEQEKLNGNECIDFNEDAEWFFSDIKEAEYQLCFMHCFSVDKFTISAKTTALLKFAENIEACHNETCSWMLVGLTHINRNGETVPALKFEDRTEY